MLIRCPHCGQSVVINGLGRKAFNIPVIKVCNALRLYPSVPTAAESLRCSRGVIYKILKQHGMTPADIIKGHATKDNRMLHKEG